jgi:8-oxo-dGTP pyrophosphatase MutT (NUDIX family)
VAGSFFGKNTLWAFYNNNMNAELLFPNNATKEELQIAWRLIAEISDNDFGFNNPKPIKGDKTRFNVRCILQNNSGEVCVVKSEKYGYIQIPGGGINDEETIVDALHREVREETGFLIVNVKPIGYVLEKREDVQNHHDWNKAVSYVFSASLGEEVGTNYTEDENVDDFRPIWMTLDQFIAEKEELKNKANSYSGCFSDKRDLEIAKFFKAKLSRP